MNGKAWVLSVALLLPVGSVLAGVAVEIVTPGVVLHLGDRDRRGAITRLRRRTFTARRPFTIPVCLRTRLGRRRARPITAGRTARGITPNPPPRPRRWRSLPETASALNRR